MGVKIKPESEISIHITLTSVISGLFHIDIFTEVVYFGNSRCKVGKTQPGAPPTTPADVIAAALTWL